MSRTRWAMRKGSHGSMNYRASGSSSHLESSRLHHHHTKPPSLYSPQTLDFHLPSTQGIKWPHPLTIRARLPNSIGLLSKPTPSRWMTLSVMQLRMWLGCPRRCVVRVLDMYSRMGSVRETSEGTWLGQLPASRMGDLGGVGGVRTGTSPDQRK